MPLGIGEPQEPVKLVIDEPASYLVHPPHTQRVEKIKELLVLQVVDKYILCQEVIRLDNGTPSVAATSPSWDRADNFKVLAKLPPGIGFKKSDETI